MPVTQIAFKQPVKELLFLVAGRVCGDGNDTQHIVEAGDCEVACDMFTRYLQSLCDDEDAPVFVVSAVPLDQAIAERLTQSD